MLNFKFHRDNYGRLSALSLSMKVVGGISEHQIKEIVESIEHEVYRDNSILKMIEGSRLLPVIVEVEKMDFSFMPIRTSPSIECPPELEDRLKNPEKYSTKIKNNKLKLLL